MAININGDEPNVVVAKSTISFLSAGINSDNTEIIFKVDGSLKSYKPGRAINGISGFEANKGYYLVAKQDIDLESIVVPPITSTPQLLAPGSFTAVSAGSTQINLSWVSSANATGYVVDRATNSAFTTGVALGIYSGSGNSFNDTGLATTSQYYYRIRATAVGYTDSPYSTANATTSLSEEVIVWSQLSNATTNSEGDLISANTTTPSGGTATKKLNKVNGAYVQYVMPADTSECAAAVLILSTANDANYLYNQPAHFNFLFLNSGNMNWFNNASYETQGAPVGGEIFRIEVSGNDLLLRHSTNGGTSFTTLDTAAGTLSGITDIFIKGSLAAGSAGLKLNNVSGFNLTII